jgi:RNA polymerase sigma factor (sigma-70 family)
MRNIAPRDRSSRETRYSLIARLSNHGDDSGWRAFVHTYGDLLRHVARRSGLSDAEADDAVQETIITISANIDRFEPRPEKGSFRAWLLQQARWRIQDQFRRRKRIAVEPQAAAKDTTPNTGPLPADERPFEQLWDEEWHGHVLRTAIDQLKAKVSPRQFQIFDFHVRQGMGVEETARALGTTIASVYMTRYRLSRLMRAAIRKAQTEV